jgi:hypothetical protein
MTQLQDYFNIVAYGGIDSPPPWIDEDTARCGCHGSGWFISDVDTLHQCPIHYRGQPYPGQEEDELPTYTCPDDCKYNYNEDGCQLTKPPKAHSFERSGYPICPAYVANTSFPMAMKEG